MNTTIKHIILRSLKKTLFFFPNFIANHEIINYSTLTETTEITLKTYLILLIPKTRRAMDFCFFNLRSTKNQHCNCKNSKR
jgi:hypothetical protein